MLRNYSVEIKMGLFNDVQNLFCMKCINLNYPYAARDQG